MMEGPSADSEEKHEPVSDIDTAVGGDGLKALDLEWPIREAEVGQPLRVHVKSQSRCRNSLEKSCGTHGPWQVSGTRFRVDNGTCARPRLRLVAVHGTGL